MSFDPVTAAVIQQSFDGWVQLCQDSRTNDEKWFRKDFVRMYQAFARQKIQHAGHLPGLIEKSNTARGFVDHVPAPALIGDLEPKKQITLVKKKEEIAA